MEELLKEFEKKTGGILSGLKQEIVSVRTNRPNPQLLENIMVECAGQMLMIKQVGSIAVQPPRDIVITVWDKSFLAAVAKAIETSPLHLTPMTDGSVVRVRLPSLTEERRQDLIRFVRSMAEKARIKLRAERDDGNKRAVKAFDEKRLSEDQKFKAKEGIQKLMDKANGEIEAIIANKVKEISE